MQLKPLLLITVFFLLQGLETKNIIPKKSNFKLVIDQDGGADDAMAVILSILYEKYFNGMEIVAVTTVNGNVNETQCFENTQRFLDITGRRDIPIYRGATRSLVISMESDLYFGQDGLGDNVNNEIQPIRAQDQQAAIGLIELSKKYEGELVVMAIGPVTNIALAQRLDPEFIGRLAQLYVGGGHIPSERFDKPEFNAEMDAEAYRIITDDATPDKVTFVPFSQILTYLNVTKDWRINVLGAIDTPIIRDLNKFERISLATSDDWTLLDPAVAAIVHDSSLVGEYRLANHSIQLCGAERAINLNSFEPESNVRLVYTVCKDAYKKLLFDIFSAELKVCESKRQKKY